MLLEGLVLHTNEFQALINRYTEELKRLDKSIKNEHKVISTATAPNNEDATTPLDLGATNAPAQMPPTSSTYEEFLETATSLGTLKIQAFSAQQVYPVSGAEIVISKDFPDRSRVFYRLITDSDGIVDNIVLPTQSRVGTNAPNTTEVAPYEVYNIKASHPDFLPIELISVAIFDGIKSIQPISFIPNSSRE